MIFKQGDINKSHSNDEVEDSVPRVNWSSASDAHILEYSRTPLLRPHSKSGWSGRKIGVVVHEGLDYFITCALWYRVSII